MFGALHLNKRNMPRNAPKLNWWYIMIIIQEVINKSVCTHASATLIGPTLWCHLTSSQSWIFEVLTSSVSYLRPAKVRISHVEIAWLMKRILKSSNLWEYGTFKTTTSRIIQVDEWTWEFTVLHQSIQSYPLTCNAILMNRRSSLIVVQKT